jgi:ribosomal protein L19
MRIVEGDKERIQMFQGVVIKIHNSHGSPRVLWCRRREDLPLCVSPGSAC